ncbi:MAG: zf-HC2 domain-containing protein, partial [Anaerolineales bacterium]
MPVETHVNELLAAYALDCLDKGEKEQVERHLERCGQCRDELVTYQEVAGLLPFGAPSVDPQPELKARLMAQVQKRAGSEPHKASSTGWIDLISNWMRRAAPVWGTVSLVLVILLGVSNLLLWGQ